MSTPTFKLPPVMIYGQSCLRGICQAVPSDYPLDALQAQIDTLFDVATSAGAWSISAPQIGWMVRVFVLKVNGSDNDRRMFINPVLTWNSNDTSTFNDSCISIPGYNADAEGNLVPRYSEVKLSYQTIVGSGANATLEWQRDVVFSGGSAYNVQHELEHLDGILYVDHIDNTSINPNASSPPANSLGYGYGRSNLNDAALKQIMDGNYSASYNTQPVSRA